MITIDNEIGTREKLLISAKQEFLKNGFQKASLRVICKNAELTTGALYFFFKNKEDIFNHLVTDAAKEFKNMIYSFSEQEKKEYRKTLTNSKANNDHSDILHEKEIMKYLYLNKDAFILLFLKAQGSSYENYHDEITELLEKLFGEFFQICVDVKTTNQQMIQHAIHYMVSWRIHSYLEVLNNDQLSLKEVLVQAEIIANYAIGGFQYVIQYIT